MAFLVPFDTYSKVAQDDNELVIFSNWLSVQESVHNDSLDEDEPIYDRLSEKFYSLYRSTGQEIYLRYSLFEAGRNKRSQILSRLSDIELNSVSQIIDILNGEISADFYSIRPFSAEDLYVFLTIRIPEDLTENAEALMDHWLSNLSSTFEENPIKGAMKAQLLVNGYYELNDLQKVFEAGRLIIQDHPFPNSFFTFSLFNSIAYAARNQGYYLDALKIYEDILFPIAQDLNYSDRYLRIRMDYANALFRLGYARLALEEYEYVYSQGIQNLDLRYRPALFNNLAVSYLNTGQFDRYVQFQLEAFEIAQADDNFTQQLGILQNLFNFYWRQNDTQLALNYINQALELSQKYNLPSETAGVLLSLGVYKRETENLPEEALQNFYEALRLSEESDSYQQHFNSYIELGETHHVLNNLTEAENYFKEALTISNSRDDQRSYSMAVVRYANMLTDNSRFEEARQIMQEIENSDLEQIPFDLEVLAKNVRIKLYEFDGQIDQAVNLSSEIIEEIFDWLQESTDMQTGHMRMDAEFAETFQLHTELLRQKSEFEEAIAVTGRLRNLSRTGFYNNPLLKSQILSEEELIKDYNLSNRIEDLRNRYSNATEDQKVTLGSELANANAERNNLLNQAFPNYNAGDFEEVLPQAMDKMSSDQIVIYFSVFEDQIFQYFITSEKIDMRAYPANDGHLDLLENAVSSFGHGSTDLSLLHDVYKTYFAGNIPAGIEHIYMIPDGVFYRIPIEILPVNPVNSPNSYGSSTYLIENYSVSYLNTLSDLLNESKNSNYSYDMAGFGVSNFSAAGHPQLPDLPFSPREITNSAEQMDKLTNNRFFINDQSTESNFRSIAGKAKIIHLATHSKVDDDNPLFSSLYMYSGTTQTEGDTVETENDGIVHAYELFDLNLNADLIFLSSCESGSGGYLKGSGILGFSRAFTYAGAQSLSINLWPIRDQTASEISSEFYSSLNQGKNKAEALRDARLHYLNHSNSDPYLWGAFIMYGNIEPSVNNYQLAIQLLLSGLLFTGLCFVLIFAYQKKALIKSWVL